MERRSGGGLEIPDEAAASRAEPTPGPERATCRCGHDRSHTMVSPSADYSVLGWAFILVGVSWEPKAISFVCRTCDQVVERIRDPKAMAQVRLAG